VNTLLDPTLSLDANEEFFIDPSEDKAHGKMRVLGMRDALVLTDGAP
jgi:hypothetical protein